MLDFGPLNSLQTYPRNGDIQGDVQGGITGTEDHEQGVSGLWKLRESHGTEHE